MKIKYLYLITLFIIFTNVIKCQDCVEILKLNASENYFFSPSARNLVTFERIGEVSSEGPYSYDMTIYSINQNKVIFKDTLLETYADAGHMFWLNDSILFISNKGFLFINGREYEQISISKILQVINYDLIKKSTLYITADSRGKLLNYSQNGTIQTIRILKRNVFTMEGAPSIEIKWERNSNYSYVIEYSKDSIEVLKIDSLNQITIPWKKIYYQPKNNYEISLTNSMLGILNKEDKIFNIYSVNNINKNMTFSGVLSSYLLKLCK